MRVLACPCATLWAAAHTKPSAATTTLVSSTASTAQVLSLQCGQPAPPDICDHHHHPRGFSLPRVLELGHLDRDDPAEKELDLPAYRNLIQRSSDAKSALKLYWRARQQFLGVESTGIPPDGSDRGLAPPPPAETWNSIEEMGVAVLELCLAALASGLAGGENRYVLEKLFLKMQYARLPISKFQCRRLLLQCGGAANDHVLLRALYAFMRRRRMLTTALCNHSIQALGEHGKWWAALEIFETMAEAGCPPNDLTRKLIREQFSFLLRAAKRKKNSWRWSLMLLGKMEDKGLEPGKEAWDVAMVACARAGRSKETLELFARMIRAGHAPDARSFGSLLSSIEKGRLVSIRDMELVLESMRRSGVRPIESIYTTLIAAHGKAGGGAAAAIPRIVEEMQSQGVAMGLASYNAIITVCARGGDAAGAVEWMRRLEAAGIEPNSITYNKLVEALAAGNRWREAMAAYVAMVESDRLEPSPWAYDALARVCRANSIPIDHRVVGWRPRQLIQHRLEEEEIHQEP
ncbi:pentatricopeptide repeat-containing protein At3g46610 [Selaginella moellendorffii]|uniref:pentatricopeptide repeat-containing protein At3g46610 n=1 Tax=Selaginella moellendorffii TaxID=88036 RepID=UPI000D1C4843|nr:pentatricopeptide repeat-containing protein At3g46610 [Selaginella moellendorffii]|eukprot:XP_002961146.2 pentatricopeptide repeat-containing protein At3g46610 [Selaginella moellendorffii]